MATIRPNDNAPDEQVKYCLGNVDFDLGPGDGYETENRTVMADASAHPWLSVEIPQVDEVVVERPSKSVPYEDDVLAAPNTKVWDTEAAKAAAVDAQREVAAALAVQAGLDQGEPVKEGGVAVTLAADPAPEPETPPKATTKEKK